MFHWHLMSSSDRYPELAQLCALVDEAGRSCELLSHLNGDGMAACAFERLRSSDIMLLQYRHCTKSITAYVFAVLFLSLAQLAHPAFANPQTSAALLAVADERSMDFVDAYFAMEEQLHDIIELARSQFRLFECFFFLVRRGFKLF